MSGGIGVEGQRLRIAILGSRGIPARYGGFETFAEKLAVGLAAQGMDVTVYAEAPVGCSTGEGVFYDGVRIHHVTPLSLGSASVIAYDVQCLWHARSAFDVVYMLGYGAAWACWIPRLWHSQVWINLDGLEWARSKWSWWVRIYLRLMEATAARVANRVIADAQAIQNRYQCLYRSGAPSTFIPYGATFPDAISPDTALVDLGLQPDAYLLVIARMEPENHILEIIEGHALWGGHLPLVLVGDVQADNPYCRQLRALQSERVQFLGAVYETAMLSVLRQRCRAYLHGHSVGGTNPSLIEAMACSCEIIAHDNEFNREVLGSSGSYFHSKADLSVVLQALQGQTAQERQVKRQDAATRVLAQYTWEKVIRSYVCLIEQEVPGRFASGSGSA